MDEVLESVGGGNPNAAAAAEIDASIKRTLTRAVAGRVGQEDQAEVRRFLKIGLKKAEEQQERTARMTKKSTVNVIQKPSMARRAGNGVATQKRGSAARPFRTVVA
mgnify:CR=1 FL=1